MKRVLVVGEINVDLILQGCQGPPVPGTEILAEGFSMTLGSASAICAMGLARLGRCVSFLGKVGADPWGDFCLDAMKRGGIDVSPVHRRAELRTGVTVSISSREDRALVTYLGAISALEAGDVRDADLAGHDHLHVSSFFLQPGLRSGCCGLFARARTRGMSTSLDPGFDPTRRWSGIRDVLEEVDLFFPNEVELAGIGASEDHESALQSLHNGRTRTVAKLGALGCATLEDGALLSVPAFEVDAVDTTGAGDSFNAGFLDAWLSGRPVRDCLRRGAAAGALSTRGAGGTTSQPDAAEVEAMVHG